MTMREACAQGGRILKEAGIEEASLDAWYLLQYVTGITRARYFVDADRNLGAQEEEKFFFYIKKRAARIPLQHLTGVQEFMGLEFCVNEHVLIPRQDTEILVETALQIINDKTRQIRYREERVRILDLCTGSGCILLSLLKLAEEKELLCGTGIDISGKALEMAKKNARKLCLDAQFLQSDLFDEVSGVFDVVTANPPYIPSFEIEKLQEEVRFHDPRIALDGGEDGLFFYRQILLRSRTYMRKGGWLLFETGSEQAKEVAGMMEKAAGFRQILIKKDLAGLDRVVAGVYDGKVSDRKG